MQAKDPAFTAAASLKPPSREHGFEPLRVEGELPADLRGTLYRVGAGTFESFGKPHAHWFDGHGVVAGVRFAEGKALGACRLVKCDLGDESRKGRQILGRFGSAAPSLLTRIRSMWDSGVLANMGNTALLSWGSRLFSLYEASHPTEINPETLETMGATDLGVARYSFTAHPKYVPARKTTYAFGFRPLPKPTLDLYALPDGGAARYLGGVGYNASAFVHDFAATDDYLIFMCPPIFINPVATILGGKSFDRSLKYQPHKGCEIIVVPIDRPSDAWRTKVDGHFAVHVCNAFQKDGRLMLDYMGSQGAVGIDWVRSAMTGALTPSGQDQRLMRLTIDLRELSASTQQISTIVGEFPTIAPCALSREYEWANITGFRKDASDCRDFYSAIHRINIKSGKIVTYELPPGHTTTEAMFAPRTGQSADAQSESDGYLLSLNYDSTQDRSYCAIFNAAQAKLEPTAKVWFDHSIPFTFHGLFKES